MAGVTGQPGEVHTEQRTFGAVTLEAEHVTERHDPDPHNKDVSPVDLPGVVNLYAVIDGGRVLLDQFPAPQIFKAIDRAGDQSKSSGSQSKQK